MHGVEVILLALMLVTAAEAWGCEGPEVYNAGTCDAPGLAYEAADDATEEPSIYGPACYDTEGPAYYDDGQCFDVPEWCWADGKDSF